MQMDAYLKKEQFVLSHLHTLMRLLFKRFTIACCKNEDCFLNASQSHAAKMKTAF